MSFLAHSARGALRIVILLILLYDNIVYYLMPSYFETESQFSAIFFIGITLDFMQVSLTVVLLMMMIDD